jgi:uncharacterized membrane protein
MTTTINQMGRMGILFLVALNLLLGVSPGASKEATFTTIDFPGAVLTQTFDINAVGDIVGRYIDSIGNGHAFLLSQGSFSTIDPPGAAGVIPSPPCTFFPQGAGMTANRAAGINPRGDIVGRYNDAAGVTHGFLLSQGAYTTIDFPDAIYTQAIGITPAGEIVGDYIDPGCSTHGFLLSQGVFTTLDVPGALFTRTHGINPEGHIVGFYQTTDGKVHGLLLRHGSSSTIDMPGADTTFSYRINSEGEIVGSYGPTWGVVLPPGFHGYVLTKGRFTTIDVPGAASTFVVGSNPAGEIVGVYVDANRVSHGFLLSRKK